MFTTLFVIVQHYGQTFTAIVTVSIDEQWIWHHAVNSPGGSTLQYGAGRGCCALHAVFKFFFCCISSQNASNLSMEL